MSPTLASAQAADRLAYAVAKSRESSLPPLRLLLQLEPAPLGFELGRRGYHPYPLIQNRSPRSGFDFERTSSEARRSGACSDNYAPVAQ